MTDFDQFDDDEKIPKSKTQIKRDIEVLQKLVKKLLSLSKNQLKKVEMSDTLRAAIVETDRIKRRAAMRRHLQYIGKKMRTEDHQKIAHRVAMFDTTAAAYNKLFYQLEEKRDVLISENSKEVLSKYLEDNPNIEDIQLLRQLIRQSQKEMLQERKTLNKKKLLRFLREAEEKKLDLNKKLGIAL